MTNRWRIRIISGGLCSIALAVIVTVGVPWLRERAVDNKLIESLKSEDRNERCSAARELASRNVGRAVRERLEVVRSNFRRFEGGPENTYWTASSDLNEISLLMRGDDEDQGVAAQLLSTYTDPLPKKYLDWLQSKIDSGTESLQTLCLNRIALSRESGGQRLVELARKPNIADTLQGSFWFLAQLLAKTVEKDQTVELLSGLLRRSNREEVLLAGLIAIAELSSIEEALALEVELAALPGFVPRDKHYMSIEEGLAEWVAQNKRIIAVLDLSDLRLKKVALRSLAARRMDESDWLKVESLAKDSDAFVRQLVRDLLLQREELGQ